MNNLGVVNIKWQREPDKFLYIDITRPNVLGNPFRMKNNTLTERKRVIEEFRKYLWKEMQNPNSKVLQKLEEIAILKDCPIRFVCCCAPSPCHGDVIVRAIEWLRNKV